MAFWASAAHLTAKVDRLRAAETKLLQLAPRFGKRDGYTYQIKALDTEIPRSIIPLTDHNLDLVKVSDNDNAFVVHGIQVTSRKDDPLLEEEAGAMSSAPLVLLHGYMNGGAYFYRNLVGLSNYFTSVYSLDLLGWGLSSRPKFEFKQSVANLADPHPTPPANAREQHHRQEKDDRLIRSAEDFFVESLEAWRRVHDIPTMILAGHSMGGYIGVAYAERYPQHVERLILLSPAGVTAGDEQRAERIQRAREQSLWFRMLSSTWLALYNWNTTVGHVLRWMPNERAQRMISNYVEKRLPALTDQNERKAVADYLYLNNTLPGSGEYCVHALLTPMLDGLRPTETRIPHLRVPSISFLYGSHDWMDIAGGLRVQARTATNESKDVSVYRVRNAGHLLMLDNWEEVNAGVVLACGGKLADPTHAPERLVPTAEHYRTVSQREVVVAAQPDADARVAPKNENMEVAT